MNIDYLVQLLSNRLNALALSKDQAFLAGDLERINSIDAEINGVNDTLYKLRLINGVSAAATAAGTTATEVIANGISSVTDNGADIATATASLQRYDISSYATDPLHEQKITAILMAMPLDMSSPVTVDSYIQQAAPGSLVTGAMVVGSAQVYATDVRLAMALMENDSRYGTVGIAVSTMNPGNIGNTGSATRSYSSWAEGVSAVAEWLSRHHRVVLAVQENKGTIQYNTVPTSTAPVVTPTSTQSVTVPSSTPVTAPPEPPTSTSTLDQLIDKIISPSSTPPTATTTEPVIPPVEVPTSTPEIVTSTPEIVPSPSSTPPVVGDATSTVDIASSTINQ